MANFNTYQTRNFYVAGAINANVAKDRNAADSAAASAGDIALGSSKDKDFFFFTYKNGDGLITRSDTINTCMVRSVKKTTAAEMARPLMAHTITLDAAVASSLTDYKGKTFTITITFQEFIDYSPNSNYSISAVVVGDATNTASATAFYKALQQAIFKALPEKKYPYLKVFAGSTEITKANVDSANGNSNGVVLVEAPTKYVRGKLTGEPIPFVVSFSLAVSNVEEIVWGVDTVAKSVISGNTAVPANYALADLEYFALGERGDVYRGSTWPNNYEPTYLINPASGDYNVLSIEFYWQGGAENVQKSPRAIQIAAPATVSNDIVSALYDQVQALLAGVSES